MKIIVKTLQKRSHAACVTARSYKWGEARLLRLLSQALAARVCCAGEAGQSCSARGHQPGTAAGFHLCRGSPGLLQSCLLPGLCRALQQDLESPRVVEVGRSLWRPPRAAPAQQGHPEHGAQGGGQGVLSISGGDPAASLAACARAVSLTVKNRFLTFGWNFVCFSLCPLPPGLALGTTEA